MTDKQYRKQLQSPAVKALDISARTLKVSELSNIARVIAEGFLRANPDLDAYRCMMGGKPTMVVRG